MKTSISFLFKAILFAFLVEIYNCTFTIDLEPKLTIDSVTKIPKQRGIFMKEVKKDAENSNPYVDKLWKHTKRLIKYPYNLEELKMCLQKSYIFINKGEAALLLGKFTLFEYPMEKTYKGDLFKDKSFCKNYPSNDDKNKSRLEALKVYDPINSHERNFGKALFYFHESEQLLNEDAPIYLVFMLWMSRFTENLSGIISSKGKDFQDLTTMLINAASLRGSKLSLQLQLSEIIQCMKLESLDHNFSDMLENLMEQKFVTILKYGTDEELEQYFSGNKQLQMFKYQSQNKTYYPPEGAISEQDYKKIHLQSGLKQVVGDSSIDEIINSISQKSEEQINNEVQDILKDLHIEGIDPSAFKISKDQIDNLKNQLNNIKKEQKQSQISSEEWEQLKKQQEEQIQQFLDEEEDEEEESQPMDEELKAIIENKRKAKQMINERFNIGDIHTSKKITDEAIKKIVDVLDSTIHFLRQENNNKCMSCKNTANIAGQVQNLQDDVVSNELEDEDDDITLNDQLIFQNTDVTYSEMIEQNQINPTNQVEEILRMRANLGDLPAQMQLGVDYYRGNIEHNIQQNHQQAFNYFQMAADQNLPQAMYNTGLLLLNGQGTQRNGTKAKEYFEKAIELGEETGFAGLGQLYLLGLDVPQNKTKAVLYFEQAILAGHKDSIVNVAILYSTGFDNTPKNITKAIEMVIPIVQENKRAQLFLTIEMNQGRDIGMSCDTLLGHMLKKEEIDSDKDIYSQKSIKKFQVGKYEDALVYSLFASFMGFDQSYHNTGFLWKTLQKENENREKKQQSNLVCAYNDYDLCSMIFYYKDALLHKNDSFAQVGHQIYKGSYSFNSSYQLAFQLYNSTLFIPESLHSISFLYQNGQYVERNISKAIEYNDLIIKKVINKEFEMKNIFPAVLRKVYLSALNIYEQITQFFFALI